MKLLLCLHCYDIVRLFPEPRSCRCGRSWGHYTEDYSTTVQTAESLSIGIANPDFDLALKTLSRNREDFSPLLCMRAWFNPDSEADVVYLTQEKAESSPNGPDAGQEAEASPHDQESPRES